VAASKKKIYDVQLIFLKGSYIIFFFNYRKVRSFGQKTLWETKGALGTKGRYSN
jgi:hypothetical protein